MGSFSDYWENEILDHLFGKGNYTPPTIHVGLGTLVTGQTGPVLVEPSGNGYARAQTTAANWNTAADGLLDNALDIAFNTATGNWGTLTHFALFDAVVGGNMLAYGVLAQAKAAESGDTVQFAACQLSVTLG